MKFKVTPYHFEHLLKQSYSLDQIYLLKLVEANVDIQSMLNGSMKIAGLYQSLIRKGLISDSEKITTLGIQILQYLESNEGARIVKKKPELTDFDKWWKAFPGTDNFTYKGKKFDGSRALRRDVNECRTKFNKIVLEGEHTAEDLVEALKYDVLMKMENSLQTNVNKLSFIQNSLTYLMQRSYEPFMEMMKEGKEIKQSMEKPKGSTDI